MLQDSITPNVHPWRNFAAIIRPTIMTPVPYSTRVSTPRSRIRRRAFTLIELLTVIAIIGILAAIIIPTVSKVRSTARKAQCLSNLRQWGTAVRLFANDNKGMVVIFNKSGTDQLLYSQYFGQLYMVDAAGNKQMSQVVMARCPVSLARNVPVGDTGARTRDYIFVMPIGATKTVYGPTIGLPLEGNLPAYSLNQSTSPSTLILMAEARSDTNDHKWITDAANTFSPWVRDMQVNPTPDFVLHDGIANMLWLDGHVSSLSSSQTLFANPVNKPIITAWLTLK
jgi:prepilin-type N-terminal cleavage/methylation domain-containing protein/prepilin-type processing-associated H-X9-DG protein